MKPELLIGYLPQKILLIDAKTRRILHYHQGEKGGDGYCEDIDLVNRLECIGVMGTENSLFERVIKYKISLIFQYNSSRHSSHGICNFFLGTPILNQNDEVIKVLIQCLDTIDDQIYSECLQRSDDLSQLYQKQIESLNFQLQERERRFNTLMGNLRGVVYRCKYDKDWTMIYLNDHILELSGYHQKEIIENRVVSYNDIIHPDEREKVALSVVSAVEKKGQFSIEYRIVTRKGEVKWVWEDGVAILDNVGEVIFLEGYITDITKRKVTEELLRFNEHRYRALYENAPFSYQSLNSDGIILDVNPTWLRTLGYKLEDAIGKSFTKFLSQNYRAGFMRGLSQLMEKGFVRSKIIQLICQDGRLIDVLIEGRLGRVNNEDVSFCTFKDITTELAYKKALEESERRYKSMFEDSSSIMLIIDPEDGSIVDANRTACGFYGYPYDLITKMNIHQINQLERSDVQRRMSGVESSYEREFHFQHRIKGGEIRDVEVYSEIILFGERKYLCSIIHDETEKNRIKRELSIAKEKAEESDRLKSAFLANMGHEIRTPMNGIVGFSQLLNSEGISDEKRGMYTNIIIENSGRLLELVNDLLDISRIEAGQIVITREWVDMSSLVHEVISFFEPKAIEKQLFIGVEDDANLEGLFVETDKLRVRQIFNNLVGNAVKFTTQGSVCVGCKVGQGEVEFTVKDTGKGIPTHFKDTIFERFQQVEYVTENGMGGTGLGLAIAKNLVELLEGRIWVESEQGKGSVFHFTLPIREFSKVEHTYGEMDGVVPSLDRIKGKTILIVEDEEINYFFLEEILSGLELSLVRAKNGLEAVDLVENNQAIDLILMDLKMPVMGGYEASEKIKEYRPKLPIIVQSAYAMDGDKRKAKEVGCEDFISKPIDRKELLEKIIFYL